MLNVEFLFQSNNDDYIGKINFINDKNKQIIYKHKGKFFEIKDFNKLIPFVNCIKNSNLYNSFAVIIDLGNVEFADKLTYIILECVCYYLIIMNTNVCVRFKCRAGITLDGIKLSPLKYLNLKRPNTNMLTNIYINKFQKEYEYLHFRRVLTQEQKKKDSSLVSNFMQDVDSFLKIYRVSQEYRNSISEVVAELADNALEHSLCDCLIDLDITNKYKKIINDKEIKISDDDYYGINIVILNFSKNLIGEKLKDKIESIEYETDVLPRYEYVANAQNNHSVYYTESYTKDDFYVIASFQDKISGRDDDSVLGGTGLTKLLKSLEEKSDTYNCYMLSGNKVLWFQHNYLNYNENKWIGFNEENDFYNKAPCEECFRKTTFYFPGTAYNLNFVLKHENNSVKEENDDTEN